ncbi:DUF4158 domain-containing protein, partial [Nonomuraea sp. RK-328]|nr:DUF4158 domain-containing protein [Nonomuraea sp. RK-328]
MPVEFLSDGEAAAYGRFSGAPSQAELERFFYLDDADRAVIADRRGTHARLGFALQLTTARYVGRFLTDPLDVPDEVLVGPALADIPDQKGWRIQDADYGSLSRFARGKIDLEKIKRHWCDVPQLMSLFLPRSCRGGSAAG